MLVVTHDVVEAQRVLKQRVEHVKTDLVGRVPGPLGRHAAERARRNGPIFVAAPRAAPVFEQRQLPRRLLDEVLDDVLVAEKVGALDGVVTVHLEVVVVARNRRGTALRRNGVAAHRIDLRDESDGSGGIDLTRGNCSAQARGASSDDHNVVTGDFDQEFESSLGFKWTVYVTNLSSRRK